MMGFCVAAFFLSQCWSWFLFILFAESATLYDIWKPEPDPPAGNEDLGTIHASLNPS
jgi:hypothetical protein